MELLTRTMTMTSTATTPWPAWLGDADLLIPLTAIVLGFVIALFVSMGFITVAFVKAVKGGGSTQKVRQLESQEAEAFMDLQRGFKRMGERVDSLETLLMGRSQSANYDREREFE